MKDKKKSFNRDRLFAIYFVFVAMFNWGVWIDSIAQVFIHKKGMYGLLGALLSIHLWLWLLMLYSANILFNKHKKPPADPPNMPSGPPATGNGAA